MDIVVSGFFFAVGAMCGYFFVIIVLGLVRVALRALRRRVDPLGTALSDYADALTRGNKR